MAIVLLLLLVHFLRVVVVYEHVFFFPPSLSFSYSHCNASLLIFTSLKLDCFLLYLPNRYYTRNMETQRQTMQYRDI